MVADIEELEEMDASELHARRHSAKEVLTPMNGENCILPVADGTVKISGEDQGLRTATFTRERPERGEEQEILQGKSDELHSPTPLQEDSTRDVEEVKNDFWTITGEFIYRRHVEPRVKQNFSLISCSAMAKRIQEHKAERVVSKSRPAAMDLSSSIATSSSSASSAIASKSSGMRIPTGNPTAG